ncbi:MAG: response regulator [Bacteroidota bacterium]
MDPVLAHAPAVVASMPAPALLFGRELHVLSHTHHWPGAPQLLEGFAAIRDAASVAILTGTAQDIVADVFWSGTGRGYWDVVPVWEAGAVSGALATLRTTSESAASDWQGLAFRAATVPMWLVGPTGEKLGANEAAQADAVRDRLQAATADKEGRARVQQALQDMLHGHVATATFPGGETARFRPLAREGLALVEWGLDEDRPVEAQKSLPHACRTQLQALVGHLEVLRTTSLSSVQTARLDCALEEATDLIERMGGETAESPRWTVPVPSSSTMRVLAVDDCDTNLHVLLGMLGVLGVRAKGVTSGADAIQHLEDSDYDLVLLDVMLPEIDGADIAREIRETYGDRPFVVGISALPQSQRRCIEAGMDDFIAKPARLADIASTLVQFADRLHTN